MLYLIPYFEFKMVNFFGYSVESWKILKSIGLLFALYIFFQEIKRLGLQKKTVWIICFTAFFFITFFEKLLFFLSHKYLHSDGHLYQFTISSWPALGRVYFGALIGAFLAIVISTFITRQSGNFLKYLDAAMIAQVVSIFFYRIGNLLWHSHIGKITTVPWGMELQGQIRHEISLYELISMALLFWFVWPLRKKIIRPGFLSLIILAWASLSRVFLDFFRSNDLSNSNFHFKNGLTLNQVAYFVLFLISVSIIIYLVRKNRKNIIINQFIPKK